MKYFTMEWTKHLHGPLSSLFFFKLYFFYSFFFKVSFFFSYLCFFLLNSFIALLILGNYILFNLLVAILVDGFASETQIDDSEEENIPQDKKSKSISPPADIQTKSFELPIVNRVRAASSSTISYTSFKLMVNDLDEVDLQFNQSLGSQSNTTNLNNKIIDIPDIEISTLANLNSPKEKNNKLTVRILQIKINIFSNSCIEIVLCMKSIWF